VTVAADRYLRIRQLAESGHEGYAGLLRRLEAKPPADPVAARRAGKRRGSLAATIAGTCPEPIPGRL
jgi:hypothetical protein